MASGSGGVVENGSATSNEQQVPLFGLSLERVRSKEEAEPGGPHVTSNSTESYDPLVRVENLVWINGNTYYKAALDDWEQQRKSLGGKLERREKRAEELTNQVYNVVGFFSVFQGVILTAVAQLNSQATATPARPLCNKVWYPLALSLLATLAAAFGILLKFVDLRRTDNSIQNFKLRLREAERRESLLQRRGARFVFKSLQVQSSPISPTLYWRLFEEFTVFVGTGGIHRPLMTIPRRQERVLKVDRHETYREYHCRLPTGISQKSEAGVITSDDIAEYTHLTINWDLSTDTLSYKMKKQSESGVSRQANFSFFRWLVDKLGWKKQHSQHDGGGGGDGSGGNDDANDPRHGGSLNSNV